MKKNWTGCCIGLLGMAGGSSFAFAGETVACESTSHHARISCPALEMERVSKTDFCENTSLHARTSCKQQASADYWLSIAKCDNRPTAAERQACTQQAIQNRTAALAECEERFQARGDICDELGDGPYHPDIDPVDFDTHIDSPFFPLEPGTTFVYEGVTPQGMEHVEVVVTDETRVIQGVTCVQVRDTVFRDGSVHEDTLDWYAQDDEDNVWYFGENVQDFDDGLVVSLDGSFMAGVNGAKAGLIMEGNPGPGDFYRQEFDVDNAEDVARVLSLTETVTVPFGTFTNCLKTEEFSATGPGIIEFKYYAANVGLILIVNAETGARVELVNVIAK